MELISRAEAKARGLKRYFTGSPCKYEHVDERFVSNRRCRACLYAWDAKHRPLRGNANPANLRMRCQTYRAKHREQRNAEARAWRKKNPDKVVNGNLAWRKKNRLRVLAFRRAWREVNREKVRSWDHKIRAKRKGAEGQYSAADIERIYKAQKGRCAGCKSTLNGKYHVDHITALSKGGTNWPRNIQLTCEPCNRLKGAKDPLAFYQEIGLLL